MTHAIPGRRPVAEALRAGRPLREVVLTLTSAGNPSADLDHLAEAARSAGVPVRWADRGELDRLAKGVVHQGAVAVATAFRYLPLDDLAGADIVVVLDGVTDPQNLGAIARRAELAGAGGLVLRERRSAHVTPAAEKASAGALSWLGVALVPNIARALGDLAAHGLWTVGLDGGGQSQLWSCPLLDERVALVVGAESTGLSRLVAERVDARVAVPTRGRIGSLNAAAAVAVALFEVVRRRQEPGHSATD
ncbi:MAG: 23S rRNA (guanosine(2251)-2'-O)-methyltransferase RlmB [Egibacteraceae bacterium]